MKREFPATNSSPDRNKAMQALVTAAIPEDMTIAPLPPSNKVNFSSRVRLVGLVSLM